MQQLDYILQDDKLNLSILVNNLGVKYTNLANGKKIVRMNTNKRVNFLSFTKVIL